MSSRNSSISITPSPFLSRSENMACGQKIGSEQDLEKSQNYKLDFVNLCDEKLTLLFTLILDVVH